MVRKIEKPPLSEKEKIEDSARKLQTWWAVGFGMRVTDEHRIQELNTYVNQIIIKWKESEIKKLNNS